MPPPSPSRPPRSPSVLLPVVLLLVLAVSVASDLAADSKALLAFRAGVGGGAGALGWNASAANAPCSWPGVTCSAGRVSALRLPGVGLYGPIPLGTLSNLSAVSTISLRYNALAGPIPADLSALSGLQSLFLNNNKFSGGIPLFLSSLSALLRLNLAANNFSGDIPPTLGNLTRLRVLSLEDNHLSGQIPASLDLPSLTLLNVSFNKELNGSVPTLLRRMPASSFLGTGLCGGAIGPCPGEISPPSPATSLPAEKPTTVSPLGKKKLHGGLIAGIVVACVGFLLALLLIIIAVRQTHRRRKSQISEPVPARDVERKPPVSATAAVPMSEASRVAPGPSPPPAATKKLVFFGDAVTTRPFDLEDLLRASAEVLGKGAFGTTYKAVLETGVTVAVKRLKDVVMLEVEFRERVSAIGSMAHPSLVPLLAYYYSKDEKLLVYDFMHAGSLSALLHGSRGSGRSPLNWETRLSIALSAAHGIDYIHSISSAASHGNIKSSNILLTKSYQARVTEYGLATLVGPMSTTGGATGYCAPEVTDPRRVTQKADIYSFGVLLLELLTGKAPTQALVNEEGVDLPRWVQSVVREEWASEVFDMELLRYPNAEEQMVQLLELAINCTAQNPNSRLSMREVTAKIQEISSLGGGVRAETDGMDNPEADELPPSSEPGEASAI